MQLTLNRSGELLSAYAYQSPILNRDLMFMMMTFSDHSFENCCKNSSCLELVWRSYPIQVHATVNDYTCCTALADRPPLQSDAIISI